MSLDELFSPKTKNSVKNNDTIVVWFSCGAASAVAAKLILEEFSSTCKIHIVNNPVKEEHPDNLRFLLDC
jgi:3'-phosphoadenosine 5'-phosphosulfate sulfotransferase (PAPS reductase)/FAD synthetase